MEEIYETDRLFLKHLTRADARMVRDFYAKNAYEFARYEPLTIDNASNINYHATILDYEDEYFEDESMCRYYAFEKSNPFEIVGTVSFRSISHSIYQCATLGYKIDRDYRRRGYAYEMISFGLGIMEHELKLHRIEATVMPENVASLYLLEKLGFEREGLMRDKFKLNGEWEDHYLYARIFREN